MEHFSYLEEQKYKAMKGNRYHCDVFKLNEESSLQQLTTELVNAAKEEALKAGSNPLGFA